VLRRLVAAEGVNLVIPTVSAELPQLAAFRAGFGTDVRVIIGDPGPVAIASDKLYTAWQLRSAGVPVPRFGVPRDYPSADAAMQALGGPVVVTPRASHAFLGSVLIDGSRDVDWHRLPDGQIVQEYIPGAEYLPVVFGTPPRNAAAPFVVVLETVERNRGAVGTALAARRVEAGDDIDVGNLALAAVRVLGLTGPAEVSIRRRADGSPVVLAVDARFGAHSGLAPELLDAVLSSFVLPSFNPASFRQRPATYARVAVG
jgi:carbamoyl-phosphate synthase large subunit